MSTRICCFTNICLLGAGEEVDTAVAPAQAKTIGIRSKEGETAVAVSKMIDVCGYLLGDIFVSRIDGVLQTIIAVLISSLSVIDDIIDCINGYKVLARMAAYLPISIYFIMVCEFITTICGVLVSSMHGLISGFDGYGFAPATGTYTKDNNGFIGNDKKVPASSATTMNKNCSSPRGGTIIATIGGYFNSVDEYFQGASSVITATVFIGTVAQIEIGFHDSLIDSPLIIDYFTLLETLFNFLFVSFILALFQLVVYEKQKRRTVCNGNSVDKHQQVQRVNSRNFTLSTSNFYSLKRWVGGLRFILHKSFCHSMTK